MMPPRADHAGGANRLCIGLALAVKTRRLVFRGHDRQARRTTGQVAQRTESLDLGGRELHPVLHMACRNRRQVEQAADRHGGSDRLLWQAKRRLPAALQQSRRKMPACGRAGHHNAVPVDAKCFRLVPHIGERVTCVGDNIGHSHRGGQPAIRDRAGNALCRQHGRQKGRMLLRKPAPIATMNENHQGPQLARHGPEQVQPQPCRGVKHKICPRIGQIECGLRTCQIGRDRAFEIFQ